MAQAKKNSFFKKVGTYIKDAAWIQPLLIVVIIFAVLFSLGPITSGIESGWKALTTTNKMEKISYKEYIEKVNNADEDEKFIIVFTRKGCEHCPAFYKTMNEYLKSDFYSESDYKIYNVDLSTRKNDKTINGSDYYLYKDSTCGILSTTTAPQNVKDVDYVSKLDERIADFVQCVYEDNSLSLDGEIEEVSDSVYSYVSTPLIIWYVGGIETRINNCFESNSDLKDHFETDDDGENVKVTSSTYFNKFLSKFYVNELEGIESYSKEDLANDWNKTEKTFDLKYNQDGKRFYKKI